MAYTQPIHYYYDEIFDCDTLVRPGHPVVPEYLYDVVCCCRNLNRVKHPDFKYVPNKINSYMFNVPNCCYKPVLHNAINAEIIVKCVVCEDWYLVLTKPDWDLECPKCTG